MTTEAIGYSTYGAVGSTLSQTTGSSQSQQVSNSGDQSGSGNMESVIRNQIDALLANIPKGGDNKLSFKDVEDYLKEQQELWDEQVKADFEKLGINTYTQFPLSYDPAQGTVSAAEGHPDKDKIDAYFKSNADKVDKFEEIIQIGKLVRTSQQSNMTAVEMQKSIQQKAMSIWFEDNSDPTSWFKGGGMIFGNYQNYSGLDIKV